MGPKGAPTPTKYRPIPLSMGIKVLQVPSKYLQVGPLPTLGGIKGATCEYLLVPFGPLYLGIKVLASGPLLDP